MFEEINQRSFVLFHNVLQNDSDEEDDVSAAKKVMPSKVSHVIGG